MARDSVLTERETQILKMWESGSTLEQIGQHFGVTRERIRQILKKLKHRGHPVLDRAERSSAKRSRNLDAVLVHEREIISRIEQGQTIPTIAAELGLVLRHTQLAVKQIFAAGKTIGANYAPSETTLAVWKIIRRKLDEGATLHSIASELAVSHRAIVRHIRLMRESNLLPPSIYGPRPNEALQRRREAVIRQMMADNATRSEIAHRLGISVGTLAWVIAHMRIRKSN